MSSARHRHFEACRPVDALSSSVVGSKQVTARVKLVCRRFRHARERKRAGRRSSGRSGREAVTQPASRSPGRMIGRPLPGDNLARAD